MRRRIEWTNWLSCERDSVEGQVGCSMVDFLSRYGVSLNLSHVCALVADSRKEQVRCQGERCSAFEVSAALGRDT